jgi:hypothetical protein
VKNRFRLVVSVKLLQRSVAVEIDRDSVAPISPRKAPAAPSTRSRRTDVTIAC